MIAGGYAAQLSRVPLSSGLCKLLLLVSLALLSCRRTRYPGIVFLGFILFMQAGAEIVEDRLQQRFAGDSLLTQVRIVDFPRITGRAVVMLVEPLNDHRLPPRSRVSWFEPGSLPSIGDVWEFELRLKRPRGYSNPGVFDVEAWMFRQKIHATGYVVNGHRNRLLRTDTEGSIDGIRRQFVVRAKQAAESPDVAAVLAAIGVGARHLVSREQWDRYALSGTSHLMAISGLHVGLAATVAFLLLHCLAGLLRVNGNVYCAAILAGAVVATGYAAVSGFGVPAQRASLMLLAGACAVVRRRHIDPSTTVAIAAATVFILDPVATMTPGFNLSFLAVVLLLWLARRRCNPVAPGNVLGRFWGALHSLFIMQVFLLLGLMPLTVLLFQRVAFLATPVNLVAVPLFSLISVPFTLVGLAISDVFGRVGNVALRIAGKSIAWLETMIDFAVRLPFADRTVAGIDDHGWLIAIFPALWVLLPKGWPGRHVALLAVLALLLYVPQPPNEGCIDAHVLDVGQGLATVVQTAGSTLLFDTGMAFRGGGNVAEQVVVPFLKSKGIGRIDWLIVSHADTDHSGGVRALHEHTEVGVMLVGESLGEAELPSVACREGQNWQADKVSFRILHPDVAAPRNGNDSSCVLMIEAGKHGLLLTGDIEADAERELVEKNRLQVADVVVVPHHGSLTSSSAPFVDAVSPIVAIASAGHANRWGFPKARVVERWRLSGAEVRDTATSGAVSVRLCADDGLRALRADRYERRRFWRDASN